MLYKIDNEYYVKTSGNFVKVELVYTDDNVSLKPTNEKIEITNSINYEEVNFSNIKESLLAEHKKQNVQEDKTIQTKYNKKYSR